MALILNDTNFKSTILETEKVAMVDFWGDGCPPCNIVSPMVEELAREKKLNDTERRCFWAALNPDDFPN